MPQIFCAGFPDYGLHKGGTIMITLSGNRGFESDNCAPVHPRVMAALEAANRGHVPGYGYDPVTAEADSLFDRLFGRHVEVFYTFNGTGSNAAALAHLVRPHHGIVCADTSHINAAETCAPERIAGGKLLTVPSADGKVTPAQLEGVLGGWQSEHVPKPAVLSLTQVTDEGMVYTSEELRALTDAAHRHGMIVHMDGARLANAVAANRGDLAGSTAGVDVLGFGGTKNGMMFGEAVVFLKTELAEEFAYTRKSCGQLPSKARYIAAQFIALLEDGLWLELAGNANRMARQLYRRMGGLPWFRTPYEPQANELFAHVDERIKWKLCGAFPFQHFGPEPGISRFVTSFDTEEADIDRFLACAEELYRQKG